MSERFQHILQETIHLTTREQLALIAAISQRLTQLDDMDENPVFLNDVEKTELMRRMEQVVKGEVELKPWRKSLEELKKKYA